jgi:glycosyltransferase involved in cell wall biosynthesis
MNVTDKKLNIAMLGEVFYSWGGGIDFIYFIVNGLISTNKIDPRNLFLYIPERKRGFFKNTLLQEEKPIIEVINSINKDIHICFFPRSRYGLINALKKNKINVCLPAANSLGKSFPIPWIGYIYDFQHKYLPQFFKAEECFRRDISFIKMLSDAKSVIINSKAAKEDVFKFYPYCSCKVFNLPFAPLISNSWVKPINEQYLRDKYQLPEKYFMISSQLFVHKSHITAFEALSQLKREKNIFDIHIICTGDTYDHRNPNYFNEIQERINELNISDRIRFLGFIPKEDQIDIMRNALAVLQPTLFEGGPGGGAVYNAVALGIPAIVSDIPVNLEIDVAGVEFFKTGSSDDLMEKMYKLLTKKTNKPSEEQLIENIKNYAIELGEKLFEAIDFTLK